MPSSHSTLFMKEPPLKPGPVELALRKGGGKGWPAWCVGGGYYAHSFQFTNPLSQNDHLHTCIKSRSVFRTSTSPPGRLRRPWAHFFIFYTQRAHPTTFFSGIVSWRSNIDKKPGNLLEMPTQNRLLAVQSKTSLLQWSLSPSRVLCYSSRQVIQLHNGAFTSNAFFFPSDRSSFFVPRWMPIVTFFFPTDFYKRRGLKRRNIPTQIDDLCYYHSFTL